MTMVLAIVNSIRDIKQLQAAALSVSSDFWNKDRKIFN